MFPPLGPLLLTLILLSQQVISILNTEPSSLMPPPANNRPTSGWPGALALDVDGYPTAPSELELQQVHVFVRHGERTPVGVRLNTPPANVPEHWLMCKTARRFRAAVSSTLSPLDRPDPEEAHYNSEEQLPIRKVVERPDGSVIEGECLLGELTDLGRQTTYDFGRDLRRLYVDRLHFLPDTIHSSSQVYFRSTNMPRTTESLYQVIHGLYPANKCTDGFVPQVRIRNGKDENLIGNTLACKRLEILQIGFAQAAAAAWNHTLEPLDKKISKYINNQPIRLDGKPRASGVLDTVRSAVAHDVAVPPEFKEKGVIDVIEKAVVQEWFSDKTEEVRRLAMGRMLDDISSKMCSKASKGDEDETKILVHSTHDTALSGLMTTFDVYDEKWPAFTASITFELFRRRKPESLNSSRFNLSGVTSTLQGVLAPFSGKDRNQSDHYIRMRYQNRNLVLPMCSEEGNHLPGSPEFCTLSAFRDRVKELTPVDWEAECAPSGRTFS